MFTELFYIISFLIQMFTETRGKVCQGLDMAPGYSINKNRSNYLTELYRGCKVILKNVEVVSFNEPIDPTFLDSIEEVHGKIFIQSTNLTVLSMKNLRLVRGKKPYRNQSIRITGNINLRNVIFPSLREVANGIVFFANNFNLCHMNSINWIDITYKQTGVEYHNLSRECPPCKGDCSSCWTVDVCQKLWRSSCPTDCPTGCVNGTSTCCGEECLGGCYDHSEKCVDCKSFSDGDICRDQCPGEKYHYGFHCLEKCPDDTVHHLTSCLHTCPSNHYVTETAECMKCPIGEACPKVCPAVSINVNNVTKLKGCTTIDGSLFIKNHVIAAQGDILLPLFEPSLSNIKEITATAVIQGQHDSFTNLHFLRNLEIVKGLKSSNARTLMISLTNLRSLNLTKLRKISTGELRITTNDYLESLDLISLTEVGGEVTIQSNKNLCYVENSTFDGISNKVVVVRNKDPLECIKENKVCDAECKGGCWGPGNGMCRFCKHFKFEGICVPSCDLNISFHAGDGICKRCHSQCHGCTGEGPESCLSCKNLMEGNKCVAKCSDDHFEQPTNRSCLACPSVCKNGCTGPSTQFRKGGCNNCHLLLLVENRCINLKTNSCGDGFYMENLVLNVSHKSGEKKTDLVKTCKQCHSLCKSCTAGGTTIDVCICSHVDYHGHCQQICPPRHYIDQQKICQMCHSECDECFGPENDMCHSCKHVRINLETNETEHQDPVSSLQYNPSYFPGDVITSSDSVQVFAKASFYCTSDCPPELPSEFSFKIGELVQRSCEQTPESESSISNDTRKTTGVLVACGIGILIVVVIIVVVMRRQKIVAESNKAKLEAHLKSIEFCHDLEPIVTSTNVRPDLANIRFIKETELERGETIGSGAFGTVYRGIWKPEDENIKVGVAIKVLIEGSSSAQHQELLEEARVMASVKHPCCIRILAVCLTRQMMLITPLVAHGSLLDYIRNNGQSIGSYTMLKWATQIARGMNYLEQKGIVHRDLAARNILVQGINQVKITDFGLAKLLTKEEGFLSTGGKVPVKWLALESIQHRIFTHKSDVWSYGVTLWELFTYGKRPYQDVSALDVVDRLENGERLPQPSICTIDVYMVLFKCWTVDASSRPTFHELELEFEAMGQDPKRYLIIQGDKHSRIPSDFIEDNRSELLRQMRLSDSDDFVCGEDYLDPVFQFPKRLSSKRKTSFLTKVMEEEETSFQTFPEYTNSPQDSSFRPSFEHQPSNLSSGSVDGTFTHLVAASAALEGNRTRKSSDRYSEYPNAQYVNKQPPKSTSSDEKDFLKPQKLTYLNENVSKFKKNKPNVNSENYLEPMSQSRAMFLENPEYMEQSAGNVEELGTANNATENSSKKDLIKTYFSKNLTPIINDSDYYNEFTDFDSDKIEGIAYTKLELS